ncbi:hypothetical protein DdX_12711 [Ditylenchus destructor]|uniref:Uncharacterized protein n=1 Tax=Ditylenchus destructor TaxID=166010 RepID=A0AAD4R053_9BILA|nr:hypothetical protein DdX_12711 [Ditylenchus destructor]
MRPYLGPSVRIQSTYFSVVRNSTYYPEHVEEIESIAYLWRDGDIDVGDDPYRRIRAEDFEPILNSPTILQCRVLRMDNAQLSFKDYKVLYSVKIIDTWYDEENVDPNCWLEFLEQPGVKPIIVLCGYRHGNIDIALDRLKEAFSSARSPNPFKIVFAELCDVVLTEFRETNKNSNEISG